MHSINAYADADATDTEDGADASTNADPINAAAAKCAVAGVCLPCLFANASTVNWYSSFCWSFFCC